MYSVPLHGRTWGPEIAGRGNGSHTEPLVKRKLGTPVWGEGRIGSTRSLMNGNLYRDFGMREWEVHRVPGIREKMRGKFLKEANGRMAHKDLLCYNRGMQEVPDVQRSQPAEGTKYVTPK